MEPCVTIFTSQPTLVFARTRRKSIAKRRGFQTDLMKFIRGRHGPSEQSRPITPSWQAYLNCRKLCRTRPEVKVLPVPAPAMTWQPPAHQPRWLPPGRAGVSLGVSLIWLFTTTSTPTKNCSVSAFFGTIAQTTLISETSNLSAKLNLSQTAPRRLCDR